jgi:hypothetical protein
MITKKITHCYDCINFDLSRDAREPARCKVDDTIIEYVAPKNEYDDFFGWVKKKCDNYKKVKRRN